MGLWSRLLRWGRRDQEAAAADADEEPEGAPAPASNTIELPAEPFVFECRECGKVFEARRTRPRCSECESSDVALMSG